MTSTPDDAERHARNRLFCSEQVAAFRMSAESVERRLAFEAEFGDWLTCENQRVEATGIPGADLRPW